MNEHNEQADNEQADNEVPGTSGSSIEHDIEVRFGAVAGAVDLGNPSQMLETVRATATKRRRRRQGVGAIAAVGALGLSGVVLANVTSGDDGDLVVSAPVTNPVVEPEPEDDAVAPGTPDDDALEAAQGVEDAPATTIAEGVLRVTPTNSEISSDSAMVVEQGITFGAVQLYPWKGGFLSIREDPQPQPLPLELPESVTAQFPQEVQDLFPDGLPPTIEEATAILQEAGLFEVVSEIVLADPEVSAAIYSQQSEVVRTVRFSEDGIEWRDIETAFPDEEAVNSLFSTGDRVVFTTSEYPEAPDGGHPDGPSTVVVWSSTDLIEWERQDIAVPETGDDLPDFISYGVEPSRIAANDSGWVLPFFVYSSVDTMSLIEDEELVAQLDLGELYAGSGVTESGVNIEIYDPMSGDAGNGPGLVSTLDFTWAELGVDAPPSGLWSGPGNAITFSAAWGAEPVRLGPATERSRQIQQVLPLRDGFVSVGENIELSGDGIDWSPVDLPIDGYADWVVDTDNGVLIAVTDDVGGQQHFLFDAASTEFSPIDFPELPSQASAQQYGPGYVMLMQFPQESFDSNGPGGSLAVVEAEGYRFELEIIGLTRGGGDAATSTYTLTDIESGEVVSTETITGGPAGGSEFEFATEGSDLDGDGREGFRLFDPETGDDLFFATFESMTFTSLNSDGEPIETNDSDGDVVVTADGPAVVDDFNEPNSFVVAAVGDELIVEQISGSNSEGYFFSSVAANNGVVLVANYDGSFVRLTPQG